MTSETNSEPKGTILLYQFSLFKPVALNYFLEDYIIWMKTTTHSLGLGTKKGKGNF